MLAIREVMKRVNCTSCMDKLRGCPTPIVCWERDMKSILTWDDPRGRYEAPKL